MALAVLLHACGGGGEPSTSVTDPGTNNPTPTPTTARITIQTATSVPSIYGGTIYGRSGSASFVRGQFQSSDQRCGSGPARTCTWQVNVGDTVTLMATDVQAQAEIYMYQIVSAPDDPRGISSQFVSFSTPCIARARGVCTFRVTGDVTITAQYKAMTLTRFFFSGLNPWELTITAPPTLTLAAISPSDVVTTSGHYGLFSTGVSFGRCIGESPGVRCLAVTTADNSNIKMEVYPPQGVTPPGSPGPLNFAGWGGACTGGPSQFGISACNLTSGVDQIAIVKWEYYRCFTPPPNVNSYAVEGNGGWKIEAGSPLIAGCTLTQ